MYGRYDADYTPFRYRGLLFLGWLPATLVFAVRYLSASTGSLHPEDAFFLLSPATLVAVKYALLILTGVVAYRLVVQYMLLSSSARRIMGYLFPLVALCVPASMVQYILMLLSVMLLWLIFKLYQHPDDVVTSLNLGLLFGACTLLWAPMLLLWLMLPMALYKMRALSWHNWLSGWVGYVVPFFILMPCAYALPQLGIWNYLMAMGNYTVMPQWIWDTYAHVRDWWQYSPLLLALFFIPAFLGFRITLLDGPLRTRLQLSLICSITFVLMLLGLFWGQNVVGFFALMVVPVSILTALILNYASRLILLVLCLLVAVVCLSVSLLPIFRPVF